MYSMLYACVAFIRQAKDAKNYESLFLISLISLVFTSTHETPFILYSVFKFSTHLNNFLKNKNVFESYIRAVHSIESKANKMNNH